MLTKSEKEALTKMVREALSATWVAGASAYSDWEKRQRGQKMEQDAKEVLFKFIYEEL